MEKKSGKKIILSIVLVLIAIIQLYPLYWLITFSLKDNSENLGGNVMGLPHIWRWGNYKEALVNGDILRYLFNSVVYSGLTIIVAGILAAMAAYAIARMKWKLKGLAFGFFTVGIMVPSQAALLPLFLMLDKMKLKGGYVGLLIPYIAFAIPMSVMILTSFYKGIPKEMEEAAYIDGCGIFRCFARIILPMIKPALATASIFSFLSTWNELIFAQTLIDDSKFSTIPVGINSFVGQYSTDWGLIGAGMVVATLPTIIVYFLLSNQVQESLVAGAVKG
jgi:ABC-type sugar transport system, permease component